VDTKQMLDQAAKAAQYTIAGWKKDGDGVDVAILADHVFWQPLLRNGITDCMGDALRLTVRLGIDINPVVYPVYIEDPLEAVASAHYFSKEGMPRSLRISERYVSDPDSAVCSAIVRAAVEIAQYR